MIGIKTILVPTDFDKAADTALAYGRELATRFGAALHVVHVAENIYLSTFGAESAATMAPQLQAEIEEHARKRLDELAAAIKDPRVTATLLTSAAPAFAIVDYAKTHGVDLIVMGTHGRGPLAHLVMGSVAERVVRMAPCPVLTVRNPEREFVHPSATAAAAVA